MLIQRLVSHIVLKYLVVPKPPIVEANKIKIACIGDSITFGAGVIQNHDTSTWEYYLNKQLGDKYQVLNYGISGRTLQKEGDYPYTKEKFYRISHDIKADIYIIMLGTNDAKPYNWNEKRYEEQLEQFVDSYKQLDNEPQIILMAPPSCFVDKKLGKVGYDIEPAHVDGAIYKTVRALAERMKLKCIDLHTFTANHSEWFDDGVHPNYEGNKEIANYIFENFLP